MGFCTIGPRMTGEQIDEREALIAAGSDPAAVEAFQALEIPGGPTSYSEATPYAILTNNSDPKWSQRVLKRDGDAYIATEAVLNSRRSSMQPVRQPVRRLLSGRRSRSAGRRVATAAGSRGSPRSRSDDEPSPASRLARLLRAVRAFLGGDQ